MTISNALSVATTGLMRNTATFAKSADRVVQQSARSVENQTSVASEIVTMKQAKIGYAANAEVIRTVDDMTATLLDIKA